MKTCAVIPAAGSGTRLGSPTPKILLPMSDTETVLSVLYKKLRPLVDHIHIIASPVAAPLIRSHLKDAIQANHASISIQSEPKGMGDAIFGSHAFWSEAQKIVVVWGDQISLSEQTLKSALQFHNNDEKTIVLPLTKMQHPYVEYVFNHQSRLERVNQSREGDICSEGGLADVGTFILSVAGLLSEWKQYTQNLLYGVETGEINFLPFLPFLDRQGWQVRMTEVADPIESRGINTADDLLFFQQLYSKNVEQVF